MTGQSGRVCSDLLREIRGWFFIGNSEPASGVDVGDAVAVLAQFADQIRDSGHGLAEGSGVGNLRANVNADAENLQIASAGYLVIELARIPDRHTEFVFMQAGGNVGMGFGGDVRIYTQCDGSGGVQPSGALCEGPQLRFALDIEEHDLRLQGGGEFFARFPNT